MAETDDFCHAVIVTVCGSFVSQVTETRTGPLGCSNYDSLDSVSSVLVHSPENKIHLKGELEITHTKTPARRWCHHPPDQRSAGPPPPASSSV